MSEIKYGLISQTDARTLEKTIDLICDEFTDATINFCEVGIYAGQTGASLSKYINSKERSVFSTGIDNKKDNEEIKYFYDNLIIGNSSEVYNQLEDNSQHLIFQDANHSYPMTISDFFCYEKKVKMGGYYALHDCGAHIAPKTSFQCMGSEDDEDMYISCRRAIKRIGLLDNKLEGWELVFDEYDTENLMGGICVFKKLY